MNYKLIIANDFPLAEVNGKLFLLDSGAHSCSFDGTSGIEINGRTFELAGGPNIPNEVMIESFGNVISGFIGIDIIEGFGIVDIDKERGVIQFGGSVHPCAREFRLFDGIHFSVSINGKDSTAFFDTGARVPVVFNRDLLNENDFVKYIDAPSGNGILRIREYAGSAALAGKTIELPMLEANEKVTGDGSDVIMGIDQFAEKYYVIDLRNSKVFFE